MYLNFYPSTLKREWYLADVCEYIHASLEGGKGWKSYMFEKGIERDAFLETYEECQEIVKLNDMKPQAMMQALSDFHDTLPFMPKPPFFSRARWFYKPLRAREVAIKTAFELVDGISTRYLP